MSVLWGVGLLPPQSTNTGKNILALTSNVHLSAVISRRFRGALWDVYTERKIPASRPHGNDSCGVISINR